MTKHKERKLFIKQVIDKMIPENTFYKMPAASKVINLNFLYNQIKDNKLINKEFKKINKNNNNQFIFKNSNFILNQSIIENEISTRLLENYFSSKKILKIFEEKSKKYHLVKKKIK